MGSSPSTVLDGNMKLGEILADYYKLNDKQRSLYFSCLRSGGKAFVVIGDFLRWGEDGNIEAFTPKKKKEVSIAVSVEEVPDRSYYLHEHLGDGTMGELKFDASTILPDRSFLITVDKKRYLIPSKSIISAVIEFHESKVKA